ncbi:uncharacterized protein LOC117219151 [Megalopta genalis]|uniref:uncharacterized protein LOC117219151 n=1 Tax=Megalopta genalis TaxID=115081 RepID=UPI0014437F64|nr:chymotrypsin inhibitor-like [Megalopta genalis]
MFRTVLVLLFTAIVYIDMCEGSADNCGDNEVLTKCPLSHEQRCGEPPSNCLGNCDAEPACQCKPLYVRNSAEVCVLPTQC